MRRRAAIRIAVELEALRRNRVQSLDPIADTLAPPQVRSSSVRRALTILGLSLSVGLTANGASAQQPTESRPGGAQGGIPTPERTEPEPPPEPKKEGAGENAGNKDDKKEENKDDKKEEKKDDKKKSTEPRFDGEKERMDYGAPKPSEPGKSPAAITGRVILFPFWLISEFIFRRPLGWLVTTAEEKDWPNQLYEFFTFGPRHEFGIFPSALFDFGLLPSVGFNAYAKEVGSTKNTVRMHFGTWGPEWINLIATDTYQFNDNESITFKAQIERRSDNPFYGMGPRSDQDNKLRYGSAQLRGEVSYENRLGRMVYVEIGGGVRSFGFREGSCCGNSSLADRVRLGAEPLPPGFANGYTAFYNRLNVAFDTRKPRPEPGSGFRIEGHAEPTFALDERGSEGNRSWVRYGGSVGAAVDLTGQQRILSLTMSAELSDPLSGTVPFVDQVALGGDTLMRGYLRGRLVDRSAAVATLEYKWPIWVFLDGVMHVAAGNVFGEHFAGFDLGLTRLSAGIGFRSASKKRESGLEVIVAGATDPLDQGASISSFRLAFGTRNGL